LHFLSLLAHHADISVRLVRVLPDAAAGVVLVPLRTDDATAMRELLVRNWRFLEPWMPQRGETWFNLDARRADLEHEEAEHAAGAGYHFAVVLDNRIVGRIDLSNVVRRVWQNATLGYWIAEEHGGNGYATAAVRQVTDFAFGSAGLHRLQAAVMPRNGASLRVLEKAGFRREGLAARYLRINGAWEDHILLAITLEEWAASGR
jgi:[ribosomal protein S5]-alanine N-acetyltransferase